MTAVSYTNSSCKIEILLPFFISQVAPWPCMIPNFVARLATGGKTANDLSYNDFTQLHSLRTAAST
ncbi:hypothetical protein JCM15457_1113 [Liquorilactobacillus sucicola DSM 21376 = JCM 15457]|nr:hypothetical protein JCM15457_1113 [Liquorilactobacillus sucicola DSM 21376 = JCM 15457]